jgi:hypothetical protein
VKVSRKARIIRYWGKARIIVFCYFVCRLRRCCELAFSLEGGEYLRDMAGERPSWDAEPSRTEQEDS